MITFQISPGKSLVALIDHAVLSLLLCKCMGIDHHLVLVHFLGGWDLGCENFVGHTIGDITVGAEEAVHSSFCFDAEVMQCVLAWLSNAPRQLILLRTDWQNALCANCFSCQKL